jgi:hypothetical protein
MRERRSSATETARRRKRSVLLSAFGQPAIIRAAEAVGGRWLGRANRRLGPQPAGFGHPVGENAAQLRWVMKRSFGRFDVFISSQPAERSFRRVADYPMYTLAITSPLNHDHFVLGLAVRHCPGCWKQKEGRCRQYRYGFHVFLHFGRALNIIGLGSPILTRQTDARFKPDGAMPALRSVRAALCKSPES